MQPDHRLEDQPLPTEYLSESDRLLLDRLRLGEEQAFEELLAVYYAPMLRLAQVYVSDASLAGEVVQDTLLGMLRGLERFEGRSSLKTWLFSILMNRARTLAKREDRYVQFDDDVTDDEPSVDPGRFFPADHPEAAEWVSLPARWDEIPESYLESRETLRRIQDAIAGLPPNQREVITLRDVEHWTAQEVCNVLGISETNQRVLLHRARSKVRQQLEDYLKPV